MLRQKAQNRCQTGKQEEAQVTDTKKRKKGRPMAEPRVKYSRVRLVASDREEEAVQIGGEPFRFCRFTSDQGIPVDIKQRMIRKGGMITIVRIGNQVGGGGGGKRSGLCINLGTQTAAGG